MDPTKSTLTAWDREIAPYLRVIESGGKRIVAGAHNIGRVLPMLRSRPEFLTRAEDALIQAEAKLAEVLAQVQDARARYAALAAERLEAAE